MELRESVRTSSRPVPRQFAQAVPERLCDKALELVDQYRYWLMAGVLVVYLIGFNGQWRVERDSALYLTIGRNLSEGRGAIYHEAPNRLVFPGLPYLLDATFRLFGTQSLLPAEIVMLLIGLATLALTYRLFLLHADRPTALVMTIGLALTRLFYRYNFELLTDLPFLMGVMGFLAGYEAIFFPRRISRESDDCPTKAECARGRWYDWVLLVGGLAIAIVMRPVMWVLLVSVVLALGWRVVRGRFTRLHVAVTVGVISAVGLFYLIGSGRGVAVGEDYEITILSRLRNFHATLASVPHNIYELIPDAVLVKALFGCKLPMPIDVGLGILVFVLGLALFTRRALWGFLVSITFLMLLIFQEPLDRYFVAVIPLLVYAWWRFLVWLNRKLPANLGNWCFLALFFGGLGCNIARIGEMVVEQRRRPFLSHYHYGRYESLDRVAKWVDEKTAPHDWILVAPGHGRILTFEARRNLFEPTEKIAVDTSRLFVLNGPAWDENKDLRQKDPEPIAEQQAHQRLISYWLAEHHLRLGPAVDESIKGPADLSYWTLYRTVPLP